MIPKDTIAALWTGNDMQGPYAAESGLLVKPADPKADAIDELFTDVEI